MKTFIDISFRNNCLSFNLSILIRIWWALNQSTKSFKEFILGFDLNILIISSSFNVGINFLHKTNNNGSEDLTFEDCIIDSVFFVRVNDLLLFIISVNNNIDLYINYQGDKFFY